MSIEAYPLSPEQRRLYDGGLAGLAAELVIQLAAPIASDVLERAFSSVCRARPLLGASFVDGPEPHGPLMILGGGSPATPSIVASADGARIRISVPAPCADTESLGWLAEDLAAALRGDALQPDEVPYPQYAAWRNQEDGSPPRSRRAVFAPRQHPHQGQLARAQELASKLGATTAATQLAALRSALRARGSAAEGLVAHGRPELELAHSIGCFAGIVPLPPPAATLADEVHACGDAVANARRAATLADAGDVAFQFEVVEGWRRLSTPLGTFDILTRRAWIGRFEVAVRIESDTVELWFDPERWDEDAVGGVLRRAEATIADALGCDVHDVATHRPADVTAFVHEYVSAHAAAAPDRTALVCGTRRVSYRELDIAAARAAGWLAERGVRRGSIVAVVGAPSIELVMWIVGTMRAGGSFLPIDPTVPAARRADVIAAAAPQVVIDEATPFPADASAAPAHATLSAADIAYVLYTSGSTGAPKGVMVSHGALGSYVAWACRAYGLGPGAVVSLFTSVGADLTITTLLAPFHAGATIEVLPPLADGELPISEVLRWGRHYQLVKLTPSHLKVVLARGGLTRGAVATLVLGGEDVARADVRRWLEDVGGTVYNEYGPTETTVGCTATAVAAAGDDPVDIGTAAAGASIRVLDQALRPVEPGERGEIYIAGPGLAHGYLGAAALTADRFVPDPYGPPGTRMYRSGDLARRSADDRVILLGRADSQVKVRGHRVEPAEVEQALARHPDVQQAAVVARRDPDGVRLVAHVVPRPWQRARALHRLPNGIVVSQVARTESELLYAEIFERGAYERHGITIGDDDVVFDVGANIGMFTLYVLGRAPGALVHAFEPSRVLHDLLRANLARHGLTAHLHQLALSARAGTAPFTFYPAMSTMSGLHADARDDLALSRQITHNRSEAHAAAAADLLRDRFDGERELVAVDTVSAVLRREGLDRIDLLKIDAEKSEADILDGIANDDWPTIRQLAVEVHDTEDRVARITSLLARRGYDVHVDTDAAHGGTALRQLYAYRPPRRTVRAGASAVYVARDLGGVLRDHLAAALPPSHVPAEIHLADELPLTSSGKLDRVALAMVRGAARTDRPAAPRTPVEARLCQLFGEVLHREDVSIDDDFFELGGDSLLGLQVVARAVRAGLSVTPRMLFRASTPRSLAAALEGTRSSSANTSVGHHRPLTPLQRRILTSEAALPAHVQCAVFRPVEGLDVDRLRAAVTAVAARHDAFAARFGRSSDGTWMTTPAMTSPGMFEVIAESNDEAHLCELLRRNIGELIDPFTGRHLGLVVMRLASAPVAFALAAHHLVMDALSWRLLLEDVAAAYGGATLAPLTIASAALARQMPQPHDHAGVPAWFAGASVPPRFATVFRRQLIGAPPPTVAPSVSIEDLALSAWVLALRAWRHVERIDLELESMGRDQLDDAHAAAAVGAFALHHPFTCELSPSNSIADVVRGVSQARRAARRLPPIGRGTAQLAFNFLGDVQRGTLRPPFAARIDYQSSVALLDEQVLVANVASAEHGLDVEVLAHCPTVAAADVERLLGTLQRTWTDVLRASRPDGSQLATHALSPVQEGTLVHSMEAPGSGRYMAAVTFELRGPLDREALSRAWDDVVAHHDALRTEVRWDGGALRQVWPAASRPLTWLDWQARDADLAARLDELIGKERRRVDLTDAPLLRAWMIDVGGERNVGVLVFHHAVLDGWSLAIVLGDVLASYATALDGAAVSLERRRPYVDYLQWIEARDEVDLRFWTDNLAGSERPPAAMASDHHLTTDVVAVPHLRAAKNVGETVTPALVAFAAWALALHRARGSRVPIFGITLSGRPPELAGSERMVGLFINTLPLAIAVEPALLVRDWLARVRERVLGISARQLTPLAALQRAFGEARGPLFDTVVVVENYPPLETSALQRTGLELGDVHFIDPSHYPITLTASLEPSATLQVTHDPARFPSAVAQAMLGDAARLIGALAESERAETLASLLERTPVDVAPTKERPSLALPQAVRRRILAGESV